MSGKPRFHSFATINRWADFRRFPVRLKLTLPYLFLVLVFSFGIGVLASKIIMETVDERFTNQLYEAGKIASEAMVNEETRLIATVRLLSNMDGVAEAIQQADAEKLREITLGTVINHQEDAVEFLNPEGILVLSLHHKKGGLVEEYDSSQGGTGFQDWELAKKAGSGQADAFGSRYADYVRADWGHYFYIASPVYNRDQQLAGVILIGKSVANLARQMREETLAQVTFYDVHGQPLASTFPLPDSLAQTTAATILENQQTESYRRNANRRDFQAFDLNYGEILGPWEVRGGADLGILGVSLMKNSLITASLPTRIQIIVLISVTVFIILLTGINLATLITQPLMNLVSASKVVAEGNLNVQVPVSSEDEIAVLAVSFNQMIDSLQQSKKDLIESYDKTLHGWSKALELRDHETQGHSQRVVDLTMELASRAGISGDDLAHVRRGAMLHDIGKMGVPDAILRKTGPLTDAEWKIMRQHPQFAYDMLSGIAYLRPALEIPYCHHEKWNGSGYPRGLRGGEIPLSARLFAIVDVWDALISDRPYRKRMEPTEAMSVILEGSGTHFDPDLVDLFQSYIEQRQDLFLDRLESSLLGSTPGFVSNN